MSFTDWLNEKKKKEEEQNSNIPSTSNSSNDAPSFSQWLYKKKSSNVDQNYINAYISDANAFFNTAQSAYDGMGWADASEITYRKIDEWNELDTRAGYISSWLEHNKSRIDEETYKNLYDSLASIQRDGTSVIRGFTNAVGFYSQWSSEGEYNKYKELYDLHNTPKSDPDYDKYSQAGAGIVNPNIDDVADRGVEIFGYLIGKRGEEVKNPVTLSRDNWEYLAKAEANGGDP